MSGNASRATTLVMVTHDPQIAERADRRIQLQDGLVVADDLQGLAVQHSGPSDAERRCDGGAESR